MKFFIFSGTEVMQQLFDIASSELAPDDISVTNITFLIFYISCGVRSFCSVLYIVLFFFKFQSVVSGLPLMIVFLGMIIFAFKIVRQEEMITILESRMSMTESYQTNICSAVIFINIY